MYVVMTEFVPFCQILTSLFGIERSFIDSLSHPVPRLPSKSAIETARQSLRQIDAVPVGRTQPTPLVHRAPAQPRGRLHRDDSEQKVSVDLRALPPPERKTQGAVVVPPGAGGRGGHSHGGDRRPERGRWPNRGYHQG